MDHCGWPYEETNNRVILMLRNGTKKVLNDYFSSTVAKCPAHTLDPCIGCGLERKTGKLMMYFKTQTAVR